jgi:hypothetical protein
MEKRAEDEGRGKVGATMSAAGKAEREREPTKAQRAERKRGKQRKTIERERWTHTDRFSLCAS